MIPHPTVTPGEPPLLDVTTICGLCRVAVVWDADAYVCPTCGTLWPDDADPGTPGDLFPTWLDDDERPS